MEQILVWMYSNLKDTLISILKESSPSSLEAYMNDRSSAFIQESGDSAFMIKKEGL